MPTVCWSQFETTTRNNLQYYWSHPQFTDVTLALEEGKEIKAHKIGPRPEYPQTTVEKGASAFELDFV